MKAGKQTNLSIVRTVYIPRGRPWFYHPVLKDVTPSISASVDSSCLDIGRGPALCRVEVDPLTGRSLPCVHGFVAIWDAL